MAQRPDGGRTERLGDLCPGRCGFTPGPFLQTLFAVMDDRLFVTGTDGMGHALFVSDATADGTRLVRRILGPKPTGTLRPAIARLTPARVEVTVERLRDGATRSYALPAVPAGSDRLDGHLDPVGFSR